MLWDHNYNAGYYLGFSLMTNIIIQVKNKEKWSAAWLSTEINEI